MGKIASSNVVLLVVLLQMHILVALDLFGDTVANIVI